MTDLSAKLSFQIKHPYRDEAANPSFSVQVRELKDDVSLEQAAAATADNGYDEVFLEAGGKRYVAYSADESLVENLAQGQASGRLADLKLDEQPAQMLKIQDETLSFFGGAWDTSKSIGRAAIVRPYQLLKPVLPNAATTGTFLGGVVLGAATRMGDLQATTRIGLALGAAGGVATVRQMTEQGSPSGKALKGGATGIASVALGAAAPEIARLIARIPVPDLVAKGFKIAGTAALVGSSIAIVGGGIAAASQMPDAKSFDAISK